MSLRDALIRGAEMMLAERPHYEPHIVSPREYADPKFMAWLKANFPNGRLVYRAHCDGCILCSKRGQPMNTTPGAVDDASRGGGLAPSDKHTPSPDGTHRGQSGSSTTTGPAASGKGAGDPTPGT